MRRLRCTPCATRRTRGAAFPTILRAAWIPTPPARGAWGANQPPATAEALEREVAASAERAPNSPATWSTTTGRWNVVARTVALAASMRLACRPPTVLPGTPAWARERPACAGPTVALESGRLAAPARTARPAPSSGRRGRRSSKRPSVFGPTSASSRRSIPVLPTRLVSVRRAPPACPCAETAPRAASLRAPAPPAILATVLSAAPTDTCAARRADASSSARRCRPVRSAVRASSAKPSPGSRTTWACASRSARPAERSRLDHCVGTQRS